MSGKEPQSGGAFLGVGLAVSLFLLAVGTVGWIAGSLGSDAPATAATEPGLDLRFDRHSIQIEKTGAEADSEQEHQLGGLRPAIWFGADRTIVFVPYWLLILLGLPLPIQWLVQRSQSASADKPRPSRS